MKIQAVYEGGQIIWHTLNRGHHVALVTEHRIDGDDYVTISEAGELRLPAVLFHDGGHGASLFLGTGQLPPDGADGGSANPEIFGEWHSFDYSPGHVAGLNLKER